MIIPVNLSEEDLIKYIEEQKENPVRESTGQINDVMVPSPPKYQPSEGQTVPQQPPSPQQGKVEYVWGFWFFESPEIYYEGRNLYFQSSITDYSINYLIKTLLEMQPKVIKRYNDLGMYDMKEMEIRLYIHSPGGSIPAGFHFIDFIKQFPIPITTVGIGTVASMAVPIVQSGSKRYLTEHCNVLIHQFRAGFQGKRQDIFDYLRHLEHIHKDLVNYISSKSRLSKAKVEEIMKSESWFTAKEALDMGIVDAII